MIVSIDDKTIKKDDAIKVFKGCNQNPSSQQIDAAMHELNLHAKVNLTLDDMYLIAQKIWVHGQSSTNTPPQSQPTQPSKNEQNTVKSNQAEHNNAKPTQQPTTQQTQNTLKPNQTTPGQPNSNLLSPTPQSKPEQNHLSPSQTQQINPQVTLS
jgi:hypothetical protein